MRKLPHLFSRPGLIALAALVAGGCGDTGRQQHTVDLADPEGTERPDFAIVFQDPPDLAINNMPPPCEDVKCKQVKCGEGLTTALSGHVYAPNGELPVYNALVYIPNAPLDPFPTGVSCDACANKVSGKPIVLALTDEKGYFRMEDVPAGDDIPMVIQMGRWRRQVILPHVEACSENPLAPRDSVQRLPRKKAEGDIPLMAIATGTYDPIECLLHKLGVDDSEFTNSQGKGRVRLYNQGGTDVMPAALPAATLYDSVAEMEKYDMIILPCSSAAPKPDQQARLAQYADAGGRVFSTDLMVSWVKQAAWNVPVNWTPGTYASTTAMVDQGFPKGRAFARWLVNSGASAVNGQVTLQEIYSRMSTVQKPVQRWLSVPDRNGGTMDLHFTFNTPLNPPPTDAGAGVRCGRVLYSSFHVASGALNGGVPRVIPGACNNAAMTPQEKALAFMMFDLTNCVQPDEEIPQPPIP